MKKVAFHNLGCKVNSYEMEYMQQEFEKNGYEIVPFAKKADIYLINTCTVTNIADRKSRQMLHRAKAMNPEALVVAAGCYVQTDPEGAAKDPMIDLLIGNDQKKHIVSIVENALAEGKKDPLRYVSDLRDQTEYEDFVLQKTREHTRVSVKIQDGCDQFCSYCIIPHARGRSRSRQEASVLSEIRSLGEKGYREVVLTGIHLSSYGLDRADVRYDEMASEGSFTNKRLADLIEAVGDLEGISRIRLGSLEPRIITEEFLERLRGIPAFCDHFHLSLQSGSDSVLRRMNRHYRTDEYLEKTKLIRSYYPSAALTTDVIVGFPGETEEEFEQTREFLSVCDFYEAHVFKYSRRKGTVADRMEGQLTERVKSERSKILIGDAIKRKRAFMEGQIGKETEVLTEEETVVGSDTYLEGFSRNYLRCALRADTCRVEDVIRGRIRGFLTDDILEVSTEK